jgi:formylglycine-generating enzyme required for sulfatase activity
MRLIPAIFLLAAEVAAQPPEFVPIPPAAPAGSRFEKPFQIGKTEVTVGQFAAFVKAQGYRTTAERENAPFTWKAPGFKLSRNQPVVYVTVKDAGAYCQWAGARLPRDAEWEYAARAGTSTRHFWGDSLDGRYLWYRANSDGRPHDVGKKLPNPWGLYDVEGNVWEWAVSDPVKGEPWASRRGGSWVDCEDIESEPGRQNSPLIGIAILFKIPVDYGHRYDDIGFRCARD